MLIRIATEDAPSIALSRPDLPAEAVEVIGRALSRDRSARFASAREMRDALRKAADAVASAEGTLRRRTPTSSTAAVHDARTREIEAPEPAASKPWPLIAGGRGGAGARRARDRLHRARRRDPLLVGRRRAGSCARAAARERAARAAGRGADRRGAGGAGAGARAARRGADAPAPAAEPAPEPSPPAASESAERAVRPRGTRPRDRGAAQQAAEPAPAEARPRAPREGTQGTRSGGFLRDLDY
ncbi:MAG: hypothetical protein M5U28_33200 [Sandaracinaceae bacterium]|nr:hypothetical protein [Sandaracinaceae bacterium]